MQHTQNYNLNKPDVTDYAKIEALNDNAEIIDAKLKELEENGDLSQIEQSISNVENELTTHLDNDVLHNISVKVIKLNKDSDGIFTTVEHRRKSDNTLARKSVLSGGTSPQYTTRTITYYKPDGTTVIKTDTFSLTYDADGDFVSEV